MQYVLFAGAISVLFFAVAQLLTRDKKPIHYCMVIGCVIVCYVLLYLWAVGVGLVARVPALAGTDTAAVFIAAPAFYLAALSVLHEGRRPVRSYAVYFVVPAFLAVGTVVYDVLSSTRHWLATASIASHFAAPYG